MGVQQPRTTLSKCCFSTASLIASTLGLLQRYLSFLTKATSGLSSSTTQSASTTSLMFPPHSHTQTPTLGVSPMNITTVSSAGALGSLCPCILEGSLEPFWWFLLPLP